MIKLYFDADVWLNFWLDEILGFVPASHYTEQLLEKMVDEGWVVVVSEAVKEEIFEKNIAPEDFREKVSKLKVRGLLEEVRVEESDDELVGKLMRERKLHFSDALHAAIAIRTKAMIVTRNIRHFERVVDLVEVRRPEDLL
jgi:predicted nucleic acid-binding protein